MNKDIKIDTERLTKLVVQSVETGCVPKFDINFGRSLCAAERIALPGSMMTVQIEKSPTRDFFQCFSALYALIDPNTYLATHKYNIDDHLPDTSPLAAESDDEECKPDCKPDAFELWRQSVALK
jgi:hypothetical protein